jgi:hypothetical protein
LDLEIALTESVLTTGKTDRPFLDLSIASTPALSGAEGNKNPPHELPYLNRLGRRGRKPVNANPD